MKQNKWEFWCEGPNHKAKWEPTHIAHTSDQSNKIDNVVWGAESKSQKSTHTCSLHKWTNKKKWEFWCEGPNHKAKNQLIHEAYTNVQTREIGISGVRGRIMKANMKSYSRPKKMYKQERFRILVWGAEAWSQKWTHTLGPREIGNSGVRGRILLSLSHTSSKIIHTKPLINQVKVQILVRGGEF